MQEAALCLLWPRFPEAYLEIVKAWGDWRSLWRVRPQPSRGNLADDAENEVESLTRVSVPSRSSVAPTLLSPVAGESVTDCQVPRLAGLSEALATRRDRAKRDARAVC